MAKAKKQIASDTNGNSFGRKAMEAIEQIDRESREKKQVQLVALQEAREAIQTRLDELNHQMAQLDAAVVKITGKAAPVERRQRRDWSEIRDRIVGWMAERSGQKFAAGQLAEAFPEIEGQVISVLLKPTIEAGQVKLDQAEGVRRQKYYVAP
jgi:predicted  nucleic acid-binding Zn-ribbon protein